MIGFILRIVEKAAGYLAAFFLGKQHEKNAETKRDLRDAKKEIKRQVSRARSRSDIDRVFEAWLRSIDEE